jgi:hypothetical protein
MGAWGHGSAGAWESGERGTGFPWHGRPARVLCFDARAVQPVPPDFYSRLGQPCYVLITGGTPVPHCEHEQEQEYEHEHEHEHEQEYEHE